MPLLAQDDGITDALCVLVLQENPYCINFLRGVKFPKNTDGIDGKPSGDVLP